MTARASPDHDRARSRAANLLIVLTGIMIPLLLAEAGLRIASISYPRVSQPDEYLGSAHRPGMEWWHADEGGARIQINREGFRDTDHALKKPKGTIRIAVLGDSFTEALQVAREDRYTEVMERELRRQRAFSGRKIEVLNFGFSGYGTAEELMVLRRNVWKYSPDIVVLAFFPGNDLRDNSRELANDPGRLYFVYRRGKLVPDFSFRKSPVHVKTWRHRLFYRLMDSSSLVQVLYRARSRLRPWIAKQTASTGATDAVSQLRPEEQELGIDAIASRPPAHKTWKEAWRVTEGLIRTMSQEVRAHKARFLVMVIPHAVLVHPDSEMRQRFMNQLEIVDFFYPDNRIKALGRRHEFPVLSLAPPLQSYAQRHRVFLHGFAQTLGRGHWNQQGHRLAGETLAKRIVSSD